MNSEEAARENMVEDLWEWGDIPTPPYSVEPKDLRLLADWIEKNDHRAMQTAFNKELDAALRCYFSGEGPDGEMCGPKIYAGADGVLEISIGDMGQYKCNVPIESAFDWVDYDTDEFDGDFCKKGWIPILENILGKLREFEGKRT